MGVKSQVLQRFFCAGDKSSKRSKRFREGSINEREMFFDAKMLGRASAMTPTAKDRMRFIDKYFRAVLIGHFNQLFQIAEVAIHRVNPFHDHKAPSSILSTQRRVERFRVVMLKFFRATTRKHRAVPQTQMRTIIENGDVGFAQQTGNSAERTAEAAVKKHGILAAEKFGNSRFQFPMKIGHAR